MKLNDVLEIEPLSKALQRALRFAHEQGASELAAWLQLEIGGYYSTNSAWVESTKVPKYRTVSGMHFNAYGQRLHLEPNVSFVNALYLREPVEVLETLKDTRRVAVVQDLDAIQWIADFLKVEVFTFHFDTVEVVSILSQIRSELLSRTQVLANTPVKQKAGENANTEDILILKPTIHGIGVDLRALWRRARRGKNSK